MSASGSSVTTNAGKPQKDARFRTVIVDTKATRGKPDKDAKFTQLVSHGTDYSFGGVGKDINVSALAVTHTLQGPVYGNGASSIGNA